MSTAQALIKRRKTAHDEYVTKPNDDTALVSTGARADLVDSLGIKNSREVGDHASGTTPDSKATFQGLVFLGLR